MNERMRILSEQMLALPVEDREELYRTLAASIGRETGFETGDAELSDEAKLFLKEAWDAGLASGPGRFDSIEDIIAEARWRFNAGERE
jgi:hypothetical protein